MESWFERARPAIFEALTDVCERIDRELHAELQTRKPILKDAGTCTADDKTPESRLAVIDNLERENMKLREQLAALTSTSTQRDDGETRRQPPDSSFPIFQPHPTPSPAEIILSSDGTKVERSDYVKLQMRFNALSENFKKAKDALQRRKDERDKWVERARMLEKKIKAAENEHGIRILDRSNRCGQEGKNNTSFTLDVGVSFQELPLPLLVQRTATTTDDSHHETIAQDPQLQSTQGEPDDETEDLPSLTVNNGHQDTPTPTIKAEPSSDTPVVVSERTLKKRRIDDDVPVAAAETRRVKVERISSSSPLPSLERYGLDIQESLDLDDIAQKMQTPRKRHIIEDSQEEGTSCEEAGPSSLTPTPLFVRPDLPHQSARVVRAASVLTPISGNKRVVKSTTDKPNTPAPKNALSHGISVLAEDGGAYGRDAFAKKYKSLNTPSSVVKSRLSTLLNSPASATGSATSLPGSPHDTLPIPERRELPFDKVGRQNNKRQTLDANPTPRFKMPDHRTPVRDRSPQRNNAGSGSVLRRKPVSELQLDDFKINPLANDGHDFAFSEVVRDKDDRACLRGCTDMHCCGKQFRALALSQRPNPPLTAAQRQEEQNLLESYLGDYSYRLATMTKEERTELWLEAKTEELANKYGKHRHRFSRMRSPPGFWNADFPDTQELQADREEASKREKQAIAERYRDAMRPRGRWLFKDE